MEFWLQFYKDWNNDLILPNIWILALFLYTMEFWPDPSKQWNSGLIVINTCLLSCPSTAITGILVLKFKFCPYFYTVWNFDVILPNIAILALSVYTLKFLSYRSKPWNSGPIFIHIYTLAFWPHPWKHCNSGLILLHIGIWISSSQTLDF